MNRSKKINVIKLDRHIIPTEYEITYDAIEDKSLKKLPSNIRDNIKELYYSALKRPKEIIPRLKELIKKYPDVSVFQNYLSAAYWSLGDTKKADEVVIEGYKRHPDYLFAKINYAQICLHNKEFEKIPEIFDNKFDLKALYPKRNKFHYTEFVGFMYTICQYFIGIGEWDDADVYYKILKKIAPWNKKTRMLKRILYPSISKRFLKRLIEYLDKKSKEHEKSIQNNNTKEG